MSIRILLICLFLSLLCTPGLAQSKFLADDYWVEQYTRKQGLPEDVVIEITQDQKGYLWMITPYYLVRYDGYEFKIFNPRKQFPELNIQFSSGLLADSNGKIWAPIRSKGLLCFDPQSQQFSHFFSAKNLRSINKWIFSDLIEDRNGNIWGSRYDGLVKIGKKKNKNKYSVQHFNTNCPESLLKNLDKITKEYRPIANLTKIGDFATKTMNIEIKKTTKILVLAMGEIANKKPTDFGWIENIKGDTIWKFDDSKSFYAGGELRNTLNLDVILLSQGKYKVSYISDDSHSWKGWYDFPPRRPHWWGIQLFKLQSSALDSIQISIKKAYNKISTRPKGIKILDLFQGSNKQLWALSDTDFGSIDTSYTSKNQFFTKRITIPIDFVPTTKFVEIDSNRLIIQGLKYNPGQHIFEGVGLTINLKKNKINLYKNGYALNLGIFGIGNTFIQDKYKNYWMGTWGDGLHFAKNTGHISSFKRIKLSNLTREQIWCLFRDRAGHIWVGTNNLGLYKISEQKPPASYIYVNKNDEKDILFGDIEEDAFGNFWLYSRGNGLFQLNPTTQQIWHYPNKKEDTDVAYLFHTKEKKLVISENLRARQYNLEKQAFEPLPITIPDSLHLIGLDNDGNYWAINKSWSIGFPELYVLNENKFTPVAFDSTYLTTNSYGDFHFGKNGNIWFSPSFTGVQLYKFNRQTNKLSFKKSFLANGTDVRDIYEDDQGIVWLGTYKDGLIRLNPKNNSFKTFTQKDGLPSDFIYKILKLKQKIWVITFAGSAFIDIAKGGIQINKKLDEYLKQKTKGYYPKSLGGPFNDRMLTTRSGKIAMTGVSGLSIFDPADFQGDPETPIMQIAQLNINGQITQMDNVSAPKALRLTHRQNDLEIEYVGLHYDQPRNNKYAYFLKGANQKWIAAGREKIARYTNLSPGYYEFYLKAANADGVWSAGKKMLSFTILPPWWRTWWFIALCVLSVMGTAYAFYLYRIRQLQKAFAFQQKAVASEMKALRAQMNPHFIFNSLNSINAFIVTNKSAQAAQQLTQFSNLMRQILDHSSKDVISLEQEIEFLENYLQIEAVRMDNKLSYSIQVAPEIDTFETEIPSMVLQPYLENAIWHGLSMRREGGKISLSISKQNDTLLLSIEDNGIGRAKAATLRKGQHHSKGMQITAERLALYAEKYHKQVAVQIIDLMDADEALGTRVEIQIGPKN